MIINIDSLKRKLLIKYPTFGSTISNLEFQEGSEIVAEGKNGKRVFNINTAATNGKVVIYNPKFLYSLSENEQIFVLAHEVCHVAFKHMYRGEGKNAKLWNTATDAVINALLKSDGLDIVEGGVGIPEAINYDAEEMYNKLLKEEKEKQEQQSNQGNQSNQGSQGKQNPESEQQETESEQEETDSGHDTHSLWGRKIEKVKEEQQEQQKPEKKEEQEKSQEEQNSQEKEEETKNAEKEKSELVKQGEREAFKQNKIERRKQLQELSKELAKKSSHEAGDEIQREGKTLFDIGIATPLIDWRKSLRQAIKYNEDYTRKNARMRNGYFKYKLEQTFIPETEIVLDTSASVSEELLKNFLRECKNILNASKVKVGCFNKEFHGFTDLKKPEDIDNMSFPIGGGTDFNVAVEAFSRKVRNKIIFTDGKSDMPRKEVKGIIWVVYGDEEINPKGGKVIKITDEQLKKLYQPFISDKEDKSR